MTWDRGWLIHRYDRVTSTMDVAAQHARFGAPDRTVVVTDEQTHGRGRGGRTWHSPPGDSLACTLLLRPPVSPDRLSALPLVTGVAVAEAIEQVAGIPARLKWPNDVWIGTDPDRRKVAGILMTSSLMKGAVDHVLVGIGINVRGQHADLPPGATSIVAATTALKANRVMLSASEASRAAANNPGIEARSFCTFPQRSDTEMVSFRRRRNLGAPGASVRGDHEIPRKLGMTPSPCRGTQDDTMSPKHDGHDLTPSVLFAVLLDRFDQAYADFLATRGQPSLNAWIDRAVLRGEPVTIEDAGRHRSGIFVGIDDDGALLLQESAATITRVVAGDVIRGPRAATQLG
ncbi:MAG: biotin--[acetyl-CoA-carboxylase] ligase [Thermomicrobiales bacterium]